MTTRLSRTSTIIAALLASTACATAQELKVGVQNLAPFLDPGRDFSNVGSHYYMNAFDTLIGKDPTKTESVWMPWLATSWKLVSPTEMELKIRQDVTFHNGDKMTAEDVVFSLDRIVNATFPPYTVRKRDTLPNIAKVEALDAETIRVTAARPEPLFETLMNVQQTMIVPKKYIASLAGDASKLEDADFEAFSLKPVGTGAYKITEFVPNQRLVYERFDGYWGPKAPFQKVTVTRIPELSARITALKNGEVDIISNVPPDQLATIEADPKLKIEGMVTHTFKTDEGDVALKCPTEVSITDRREKELNDLGFVAVVHSKGSNFSAFFGGQTVNKPKLYDLDAANANASLSSKLPYLLAASRFAHYMKVMMRDKIGSFQTRAGVEAYLNNWLAQYVLLDADASQEAKAKYPLAEGRADVTEIAGRPGSYNATVFLRPHFQMEELTTSIRLVAELPAGG